MTDARIVKVFLGSSITELKDERVRISDSISQDLTRLFENDGISIQFCKCESIHEGNDGRPDQDKIDEMLRTCDVSLFLFKDKEGKYTIHEYETARALQQENKKHKIYVYYLREGAEKKPKRLTTFQKQLKADGVFWKESDSLIEIKYMFSMGLLKNLGVHCSATVRAAGEVKKDGEALFEQCQQDHQLMHQEIEKLLAQIAPVMEDAETPIAARITQALGLYQKADLWASKTDYDKEKYSDLLYDYAQFLYGYGMYNDAEKVYLRQIPLAEELYGKEHENTAASYVSIGLVYKSQGGYPQALEYYGKALVIYEKVLGEEHPLTATSYNNIGLVYKAQGNYPQALEYYGKALAIDEKVLGKEHPDTATDYNNIGSMYYQWGKYPEALEYLEKALKIVKAKLGDNHPSTKATQEWLDATQAAMGKKKTFWQRLTGR